MTYTEAQARAMECVDPIIVLMGAGLRAEYKRVHCTASWCMAWRWKNNPDGTAQLNHEGKFTGYCGKAGPP